MTCPIVEKLDALHAKATPGEWWADGGEIRSVGKDDYDPLLFYSGSTAEELGRDKDNARVIVSLHNAWPAISAVLKAADENFAVRHDLISEKGTVPDKLALLERKANSWDRLDEAVRALRAMEAG